ncbi:MAG: iron-sulfur cluster assembly scaffold protein [Candidatus Buchananbacteria bacterium]|jgi:nitrogen fixation NifU-like protein
MAYSKLVMDHFQNPHNQGQIPGADAVGEVGNPLCGDMMKIYLKITKADSGDRLQDKISDVKFETLGCAAAIACSSVSTDMVKGQSLKQAFGLEKADIVKGLGELPPVKLHCSVLASDALKVAIENYLRDQGVLDNYPEIKNFKVAEELH